MSFKKLHNDPLLLQNIANGSEQAFHTLVNRYLPSINYVVLNLTGDASLAEDIIQDTFVKVWTNRQTLPEKTNFGGWLYRVAANIAHDALKQINHQKKYHQYLLKEEATTTALPSSITEQKELEALLHQAVSHLPRRQGEVFHLIKFEDKSYKEAAALLGVSVDTIKSNLQDAMRFIRAYCVKMVDNHADYLLLFLFPLFL